MDAYGVDNGCVDDGCVGGDGVVDENVEGGSVSHTMARGNECDGESSGVGVEVRETVDVASGCECGAITEGPSESVGKD